MLNKLSERVSCSHFIFFLFIALLPALHIYAHGRDTISLTLKDAEKLFLEKNFQLLAAKYQVTAADAAVIQAKLWDNPTLGIDQGAYNQNTKKWFDTSPSGETAVSVQQLIYLGGKRNKRINIEKINSQIARFQFYDLLRTLRYELRTDFFSLYFLEQSVSVYDRELESLKTLIEAYNTQYKHGNISFRELARLQALQFSLENERLDILKDISEKQNNLTLLTGDTLLRPVNPIVEISAVDSASVNAFSYTQLLDSGLVNRYDLRVAQADIQLSEENLSLQKSLRVPDITLGANWDRAGSYISNYNSLSLQFPIPLLNRNKGNIKIAEAQLEESKLQSTQQELEVKNEISTAYAQLLESEKLYRSASLQFNADYEKLLDGISTAFKNRTLSMLEFIDYFETYKNSKTEFNRLQNNRIAAMENLNLATGTNWFNY